MTKRTAQIIADWAIPLVLLIAATVWIRVTDFDIVFMMQYYDGQVGWIGGVEPFWKFVKKYGPIPSFIITSASVAVLIASVWVPRFVRWRTPAWFLVAVMALGPGLVVNVGFKQFWDRPRPQDLREFSRHEPFREVWSLPKPGSGASFPSGHASTAFFLMTPFFLLRRRSMRWAVFVLLLGLAYGTLMGFARMTAGAHFPSDVLWSAGFIYLVGLGISYAMRIDTRMEPATAAADAEPIQVASGEALTAPAAQHRQTASSR